MESRRLFAMIIMLFATSLIMAQGPVLKPDPIPITLRDSNYNFTSLDIGKSTINSFGFNSGIISDPFLLIQGQVAGLQVYNKGGDPNVQSIARVRGISSLDSDIQPLVVIDGVPNAAIENVDPNDIASIEVLKNGFAKAQYGARGSNGVIMITTKKHTVDSLLSVQYRGTFGVSNATKDINVLTANEFVSKGGLDLGSDNNYLSEIKRVGLSQAHSVSLSNGVKNYNYRISGNYRNTKGILKESGFNQFNGSGNLSFNLFEDRLNIDLNGLVTKKNQDLSFREAFRYAVTANPANPIFAKDSPFPFNGATFGGYFESLGLFGAYNPVAMLDLNERTNDVVSYLFSCNARYQIFRGLELGIQYAAQNKNVEFSEFGQETSYYLGRTYAGVRSGFGTINSVDNQFVFSDFYLKYQGKIKRIAYKLRAGYSYQEFESESTSFSYVWPDLAPVAGFEIRNESNKLISFYNNVSLIRDDKLFFDFGLRYEGSSLLERDSKWQLYPSAQISYDLGGFMDSEEDHFLLSGGFGVTGSQNDIYMPNPVSSFVQFLVEKNSEYDLAVNYSNSNYQIGFEVFSRVSSNVNINNIAPFQDPYTNISTRGFDLSIGAKLIDNEKVKYISNLVLSSYKSTVDFEFNVLYASPGAPGFGSASLLSIGNGDEFGQIYAPVFEGVDADGFTIYKDVNNDGQINVFSPGEENSDYDAVGSAIPDFEFGWRHNIKVASYDINVLFRGAFGHSLINLNRMFFENDSGFNEYYNGVNTSKAVEGLKEARYSSLYVENASFVKLDNLSISRSFLIGNDNRMLSLSLIGQNLMTITGYTGADPEPSFYDMDGSGYFSPGIDRRASYRPSRTISIGAKFDLN
jgi:TonB-dependent SusC/RagA subfamily outer membrane receptor